MAVIPKNSITILRDEYCKCSSRIPKEYLNKS